MSGIQKELDIKKGGTTGFHTSIVLNIQEGGELTLTGESCRIAEVAADGKEVHVDVLNAAKLTTSVQAGHKAYLIRGTVTLN